MSKTKQQTFGDVSFRDISHNDAKCDRIINGEKCGNNAIVGVYKNGYYFKTCELHSRDFWLEEINYE
ncbi:MAG: hypothetical protein ACOCT9_00975 [archaeon]